MRFDFLVAAAVAASMVSAHPGHDHHQELAERTAALQHTKKDLSHCAEKIRARGLEKRSVERRAALATHLMKRNNLKGMMAQMVSPLRIFEVTFADIGN